MDEDLQQLAEANLIALRKRLQPLYATEGKAIAEYYENLYEKLKGQDVKKLAAEKLAEAEACVRNKKNNGDSILILNSLHIVFGTYEILDIDPNRVEEANRAAGKHQALKTIDSAKKLSRKTGLHQFLHQLDRAGGAKAAGISVERINTFLMDRTPNEIETYLETNHLGSDFEPLSKREVPRKPAGSQPPSPTGGPRA